MSGLSLSVASGRTGLTGVNGSGKSTLLRLIAGQLRPAAGTVRAAGEVGYLPQTITLGTRRTVAELLGIAASRNALHAIEAGETGADAFAAVGNDWDIEECSCAWLDRLGLTGLGLTGLGLTGLDLDDPVARLSGGNVRLYGGNLAAYEDMLAGEQEAAQRAVTAASAEVRRERRDQVEAQQKQARHDRQGRRLAASGGIPKMVADARKKHAQESAGRSHELHAERLQGARDRLEGAERAVRDDAEIR